MIFKGELDVHYNPGCSEETPKDYFHPTAELHHEVGNEVYELI
ncbi:MAG: GDSL family lipase [Rickettsiales bacterium]|nr:GDSL family lipase [Rickettsiales bacterium]